MGAKKGQRSGHAKLTDAKALKIKQMIKDGFKTKLICERLDCKPYDIWNSKNNFKDLDQYVI